MSPEQVKTAPVSPRSDLFSAGVVMYEMLTGVKPFGSPDLSGILYNVVNHDPTLANEVNTSIPEPLARIVARLLEKRPEDRYSSAADALADLEAVLREPETAAAMTSETMAVTPHDVTSPLTTVTDMQERTTSIVRRPVHAVLFWIITLPRVRTRASVILLRESARRQQPTAVIPPELIERTELKQRELAAARTRERVGRYAEAITAYDSLLARHPESLIARHERDETLRLSTPRRRRRSRRSRRSPRRRPRSRRKSRRDGNGSSAGCGGRRRIED
jgi:hypothetical protein